jgi:cyclase
VLAARVIPTMLVRGRALIKGERFASWRSVGHAAQACRVHAARGVDELVLLDIGATPENRGPDLSLVEELSEACFMPLTVGGGVKSVADVDALLRAGADKVAIGTGAYVVPNLIRDCAEHFGRQAICMSIDVRGGSTVMTHCGFNGYGHNPLVTAQWAQVHGAGEILLTSIDREGTMQGYDLDLIQSISEAVSIPVIAHGGCSGPEDMLKALHAGASAVAAGALFQFTDETPQSCARWLLTQGMEVRV